MTDQPESLAAALAAFQANLPTLIKRETATVPTKTGGKYTYTYASLADVNAVVLPALGRVGLSFTCRITLTEAGRLVLAYALRHVTDTAELAGEYPLPTGTPQEIGSAVSYGRRYVLCALTGVAADEDDDGAAATAAKPARPTKQTRPPKPPVAPYVDDDMGAKDAGAVLDPGGAAMNAEGFEEDITRAGSWRELAEISGRISSVFRKNELTKMQRDRLVRQIEGRRAELDQAVPV